MSEQEMNAVPAEGTVTETKDERTLLKRFVDNHPKAWKWAKRIGTGLGIAGGLVGAFELGKATGVHSVEPVKLIDCTESEDEEVDDDGVSE